jgi:hypothetical protein
MAGKRTADKLPEALRSTAKQLGGREGPPSRNRYLRTPLTLWSRSGANVAGAAAATGAKRSAARQESGMTFQAKPELFTMQLSPSMVPDPAPVEAPSLVQMVERIAQSRPKSGAEALRALRSLFPDTSLTLRVAALQMLRELGKAGPGGALPSH